MNMDGFRKKFMIATNIIGAVILFGSMVYHIISGDKNHMLSSEEMSALLMIMGIGTSAYVAARALPGSLEYTKPEHLSVDPTCGSAKVPTNLPPPP